MTAAVQVPGRDSGSFAHRQVRMQEVADWCGGMLVGERFNLRILVDGAVAHPGDWIREDGNGFEVIASRAEADL
ncbi:hypothetical protein SEA_ECLIPTUS_70 [Gordonia phage Ecliptus]|nr:hypothetical protein SEA_SQUIDDLY_68 [Gordonia phage Squiddly]QSL99816.1 methyltransferase [Gordonia phage ODay]WAB10635.1 hypothetical protein SEA_ECLIPTUS_70 [Gordonia phage Ecliptus]